MTEPKATFSTCFGGPFMPRHPGVYAKLLGERLAEHDAQVWLVNTGWTGGPYGIGSRMSLTYTRAMIAGVLNGQLAHTELVEEPFFGLAIPTQVAGVPDAILNPRHTWPDTAAYDAQASKLAQMFRDNFKQFEDGVTAEIIAAQPKG